MKNSKRRGAQLIFPAVVFLLLPLYVLAQDPPPAQSQQDQQQQPSPTPTTQTQSGDAPPANPPTPSYPLDSQIHVAGKAVPWAGVGSPLHYGPFSLSSIDLISVYDQFYPAGQSQVEDTSLGILRANIVFSLPFKKSLFVLQYTPELAVLNGNVRGGADGNTGVSIGQTINFTPRFSFTITDGFALTHTRQIFPDQFLLIDQQNGGVVQSYFLENAGTHLQNTFGTVFNYKLSSRLLLTVAPSYIYSDTHYTQGIYIIDDWKNAVSLTYALTARSNIGYIESIEMLHPIRPISTNGLFSTNGVFYSEQVARTFWVTGKIGAESASYPGFQGTNWGVTGSFNVLKTFSNSDLGFAYTRASTLTSYVTNRQTQEADLLYDFLLSRRLKWTNGVGYLNEAGANPVTSGAYAISTMEYHLPANFSILASYTRRNQHSSTPQLLSGDRNTYVFGLRWAPPQVQGH